MVVDDTNMARNPLARSRSSDAVVSNEASLPDRVDTDTGGVTSNVAVYVRLKAPGLLLQRPLEPLRDGKSIRLHADDGTSRVFTFDGVLPHHTAQEAMFHACGARELAEALLQGMNASLLLYGNTGSGKTYTCFGPHMEDAEHLPLRETTMGLAPRMLRVLFERTREAQERGQYQFELSASLLEVYNETLRDMLVPPSLLARRQELMHRKRTNVPLTTEEARVLREGKLQVLSLKNNTHIRNALSIKLESEDQAVALMRNGLKNRVVAATALNAASSRSHAIFVVTVTRSDPATLDKLVSQLYLCDLAGAESIGEAGLTGTRAIESSNINRSLFTLGLCINALADRAANPRVPYRDSLLTRILQGSLGGNARACVIVTVDPTSRASSVQPSLRFGALTRNVSNRVHVNRVPSTNELQFLLDRARETIREQQLTIELLTAGGGSASFVPARAIAKAVAVLPFNQLLDPITQLPFEDCVVLAADGFSYSRAPLLRWLARHGTSPTLGTPAAAAEAVMVPNRHLQHLVDSHRAALDSWMQQVWW